jgi:sensor domain CHASE-containing protein
MPSEDINNPATPVVKQESLSGRLRWLLIGTFLFAHVLAAVIGIQVSRNHDEGHHLAATILAQGYAQRIQERLQTALVSTYVLASVVKQSGGRVQHFDEIAAELIALFPSVSALQLAPDGVIREIYPLEGNQQAIGHDLLGDKQRNREAAAAITLRQLSLAGPFNLVQGGVGAVGRLPIFLVNERNESHFWGFANALIKLPNLLDAAGFGGLAKAGYHYELWRLDPDTEQRQVFSRSSDQPLVAPVEYVITVYSGRWILSLAPAEGWLTFADYIKIFAYSLVAALTVTLLQYLGVRGLLRERT